MEAQDNKTSSIKPCQRSKIKTQYSIELKCLVHPKEKAQKCVESQIKKPSRLLFFFWQIVGHGHVVRQNPIFRKHLPCIHFRKIVASELLWKDCNAGTRQRHRHAVRSTALCNW